MPQHERDFTNTTRTEPGPQPDPMLNDGRAGAGRKWAVTAIIIVVLLAVMYGMTARRSETNEQQQQQRQSQIQNAPATNATTPGQALPGGRTTADAPSTAAPKTSTRGPSQ
jgi:hypothetical protein